jgi:hypothetical protein
MHEHAPAAAPIRPAQHIAGLPVSGWPRFKTRSPPSGSRSHDRHPSPDGEEALDATWFHRAKTALRVKQQELAQLTAHMAELHVAQPQGHRERFKDALIEVLRADCDDERWQAVVHSRP